MASLTFLDGVLKSDRGTATELKQSALLSATEVFVSRAHKTRADIAIYEDLTTQLLKSTPIADRRSIARLLSRHPAAPAATLRALMQDCLEVAEILFREADQLAEVDLLAVIATASDEHIDAIAARPHLSPVLVEALVRNMRPASLPILLANTTIRIPQDHLGVVKDAARKNPIVAAALGRRHEDVDDLDLTDLFLDLDDRGRRRVVQGLEILALRDFAAKRPLPAMPTPDAHRVQELARLALARDLQQVAHHLAIMLEIDRTVALRLLTDKGGEPLAIALKAVGLDAPLATRVLLFSGLEDVRNYFDVKRLIDVYETVSLRSALLLVSQWRAVKLPLPGRHRHIPVTEAGTPVRASAPAARPAPRPAAATALRDRA